MGIKEKSRRWGSANALMSEPGFLASKHVPVGNAPKSAARAKTHRASRCVSVRVPPSQHSDERIEFNRADHLMGW